MIRLGPAGSGGLGNRKGLEYIQRLGLNAMEVEFTYGVRMSNSEAKKIGDLAKAMDIVLSVHCPYYINLASEEKTKVKASKKRILESCEKAHLLKARYVVFHAGFYQKKTKEDTYMIIKKEIEDIIKVIKENRWGVVLAPELTGKKSQFGNIDEILRLRKDTGTEFCVDFAHLVAREGRIDYVKVFDRFEGIRHIHSHFSGIDYTKKGEKRHILTKKDNIIPLVKEILRSNRDITIINESPDPIGDSIKIKEIVISLRKLPYLM